MRQLLTGLIAAMAMATITLPVRAELGSDKPSDAQLLKERVNEGGTTGSGIFDIAVPPPGTTLQPVKRVPRNKFGVVGPFPLQLEDLPALVFPDTTLSERLKTARRADVFHNTAYRWPRSGTDQQPAVLPGLPYEHGRGGPQPRALESEILYSRIYLRIQCRASRAFDANQFRVHLARSGHWRR